MATETEDLYINKIKLIYEYNRKSPIFVRIAGWELENNNSQGAIEILENGLREYPDFPTPYFILGKAYCSTGEFSKAMKCYKRGSELIQSRETYHFYLRELESFKKLKSPLSLRTVKYPEEMKEEKTSQEFENNLNELAEKISKAKIPLQPALKEEMENKNSSYYVPDENIDSTMIVSETLAKIYIEQGELHEAIAVYEKLSKKDPSREDYFAKKISELKSKL